MDPVVFRAVAWGALFFGLLLLFLALRSHSRRRRAALDQAVRIERERLAAADRQRRAAVQRAAPQAPRFVNPPTPLGTSTSVHLSGGTSIGGYTPPRRSIEVINRMAQEKERKTAERRAIDLVAGDDDGKPDWLSDDNDYHMDAVKDIAAEMVATESDAFERAARMAESLLLDDKLRAQVGAAIRALKVE